MGQVLIQNYLNQLQDLRRTSGTTRESVVREAFKDLLKAEGRAHNLIFVPEYEIETPAKERRYVDGALLHELRVPFGYWEAKDEKDDLDAEIKAKFRRGYPHDNIIFDDSRQAVLIQNQNEVMRCAVDDLDALERLIGLFFGYARPEIAEFRKAVEQFKADLPAVLDALRMMIDREHEANVRFKEAAERFLEHVRETVNPSLSQADVREMLIQHILTEEIFARVFGEDEFHSKNNVAKELYALEEVFFTGGVKKRTLRGLEPYYSAIHATAARISGHHEKQSFLKVIYENFYKVYNPKAADRLGVVYTPNEIVRFMIESTDYLCQKHFGKKLIDKGVDILDPATGTGTFITEMIEYFRGSPKKLKEKYKEELHANEVAILPYYVANLNIEATYARVTGDYEEFPNLCFVDTLDNVAGLQAAKGVTSDLWGAVSEENVKRIRRQNKRKISIVIGNPPYNAHQVNENENNKNREYPEIDKRIKVSYIDTSTAQKTKLYDMYARFFRWASDRVDENGIVAFVTNLSFIESRTFDGFRKAVAQEFSDIYIVDLGGDVRSDPRLSGTKHNVFGIQTGVAISFMVKRSKTTDQNIYYMRMPQLDTAEEKLQFLRHNNFNLIGFERITPNNSSDWINQSYNDFENLIPMISSKVKSGKISSQENAIFKLYSLGVNTARDEWLYDLSPERLADKVKYFIERYDETDPKGGVFSTIIKWSRNLKRRFTSKKTESFDDLKIVKANYRPYSKRSLYYSHLYVDEVGANGQLFPWGIKNSGICFSHTGSRTDYCVLGTDGLADLHFGAAVDAYQQVGRHRFVNGERLDNITDWALTQFRTHYEPPRKKPKRPITKDAIFHYVYAVLHDPIYREKYALNLKREFPRIPFYPDFWRWADWGERLMSLHLGYESVDPWPLHRLDAPKTSKNGHPPKAMLKADKETGIIQLDSDTQLTGVPKEAWTYRLGNRSALEWILDQHKEKKPKDPTIREKFNTYRFADYKEKVIDLLMRVTRVSVETVAIVEAMRGAERD